MIDNKILIARSFGARKRQAVKLISIIILQGVFGVSSQGGRTDANLGDWQAILDDGNSSLESITLAEVHRKGRPDKYGKWQNMGKRALGSLAAFGPNARVLAVYQKDFVLDEPAIAHGYDDDTINPETLAERFGPFMTVSTLGRGGRMLTMATSSWFTSLDEWDKNDTRFTDNALKWLTAGKAKGDKKILVTSTAFYDHLVAISATKGDHIPPAKNIVNIESTLEEMTDEQFLEQLASVDLFMGSLDHLSGGKLDQLAEFARAGKSLLVGSSGHVRIYENTTSPYVNHPDTVFYSGREESVANLTHNNVARHEGDLNRLRNINDLLYLGGVGVGYYPFHGKTTKLDSMFTNQVALQWTSQFKSIGDAIDAYIKVSGDQLFVKKPSARDTDQLKKANLLASQIITLSAALRPNDAMRREITKKLEKLTVQHGELVKNPIQMALLMHEAENNYLKVYHGLINKIEKSAYAPTIDKALKPLVDERIKLRWDRYRIQPLGLYAAPGETVTLDFSDAPELIRKGFSVRISLQRHAEFASVVAWARPPILELAVPINSTKVEIASAYGGDVYLDFITDSLGFIKRFYDVGPGAWYNPTRVPTGYIKRHHQMSGADQFVTVNGGYESATFFLGKDTVADWNNRIKHLPGRVLNLVGDHSVVSVDKEILLDRNDLVDPEWMLLAADRMGYDQARIAGMEHQFSFDYILENTMVFNQHYNEMLSSGHGMHLSPKWRPDQTRDTTLEGFIGVGEDFRMHEGDHMWGSQVARLMSSNGEIDAYLWEMLVAHSAGLMGPDHQVSYQISDDTPNQKRKTVTTKYSAISPLESFAAAVDQLTEAKLEGYEFPYYDLQGEPKEPFQVHAAGNQNLVFWMTLANTQFGEKKGWDVMQEALSDRAISQWQADMGSPEPDLPEWAYKNPKAEGFAINWAAASGYDISYYMEQLWGFTISDEARVEIAKYTDGKHVSLPFGSEYSYEPLQLKKRTRSRDSRMALNLVKNTILLDAKGVLKNPLNSKISVSNPSHGTITQDTKNRDVWIYTPDVNYVGYDQFTYTASIQAGRGTMKETFTLNVHVAADITPLNISTAANIKAITNRFGQGATVEEWIGMWDPKEGEVVTTMSEQKMLDKLHAGTEPIPPNRAYKTVGGMASLPHKTDGIPKRMRAYFQAPETAYYRFYAELDNNPRWGKGKPVTAEVWLNPKGTDRAGAKKIISGANAILPARWSQKGVSDPIKLVAGKRYYLEICSGSAIYISIGITHSATKEPIPADLNTAEVIPNHYLIPYSAPRSIVPEDDVVTIANSGTSIIDVMANDKDPERADIHDLSNVNLVYASEAHHGTVSIANNQLRYTPDANFTGTERIAYFIQSDVIGSRSRKGVVIISVGPEGTSLAGPVQSTVNTKPVANADQHAAATSKPVYIRVLKNDTDADGDKLSVISITQPSTGSARIHVDGEKLEYTPPAGGLQGKERAEFAYQITDAHGGKAAGRVTITSIDGIVKQAVPWIETFDRNDAGVQDSGETAWVLDDSTVKDDAQGGYGLTQRMLHISGTQSKGGTEYVEWRSAYIDISGHSNITVSMDAKNSKKVSKKGFVKFMYRLDGNSKLYNIAEIKGVVNADESFKTYSKSNISGKRIQLIIQASAQWKSSAYDIDNIQCVPYSLKPRGKK